MRTLLLIAATVLLSGCVAPGSAIGRLGLKARCDQQSEAPKEVRVFLAKDYGIGGLDRYFGKPEDYGHRDLEQVASAAEGRYRIEFPPVVYHISFWLLPPLGAYPKQPPPPVYYLRFSGSEEEVYLVGIDKSGFRYRVFDRQSRQEKKPSEAAWILADGRYIAESDANGRQTWFIEFTLKKPNKATEPTTIAVTSRAPSRDTPAPISTISLSHQSS